MVIFTASGVSAQPVMPQQTDLFSVLPTVTSLAPNSGPVAGATSVTVNGSCFDPGSRFFFGPNQGSVAQCSSTQCTVYSPAATESGVVDVVAETQGAKNVTSTADLFTYIGPVITSVRPSTGPITGGTPVVVEGTGFPQYNGAVFSLHPPMTWTFGGIRAFADCYPTWCTLQTPGTYNPGPVDVEIDAFGTFNVLPGGFTYTATPKLIRFEASSTYSGYSEVAGLDGNAPAGGASVTVTSSDPSLVVPTSPINIPGNASAIQWTTASAPVTVNPSPTNQTVTLNATYNGTTLTSNLNVLASPPLTIAINETALDKGQSADVTVGINSPAPPGGATVSLSSSSSSAISVPPTVTIPAGSYSTTFLITNQYSGGSNMVTISGAYNGASASDSIIVFTPAPRCAQQSCRRLYYWNPDDCRCEKLVLQPH